MLNNQRNLPVLSLPYLLLYTLLRAFFKLLYHQFAWTYDRVASIVSLGAWQNWVQSVVPYIDGPRTLELGFGPGHLQVKLHQKGIMVCGLDESPQMARIAYRRMNRLGLYPNLIRGFAQILPFADESFHQVVMTFPSEFIFTQSTIIEIYRVLVEGGKVIILPLAWITGQKPLERAVAWLNTITGEAPEWDEKYLEPLKKQGFRVSWQMHNFTSSKILVIQLIK